MAQSWGESPTKNGPMARWRSSFRGLDYGMAGAVNGTQKSKCHSFAMAVWMLDCTHGIPTFATRKCCDL